MSISTTLLRSPEHDQTEHRGQRRCGQDPQLRLVGYDPIVEREAGDEERNREADTGDRGHTETRGSTPHLWATVTDRSGRRCR